MRFPEGVENADNMRSHKVKYAPTGPRARAYFSAGAVPNRLKH